MCLVPMQVTIRGAESKSFTYDFVFPPTVGQQEVYDSAVAKVVGQLYKGECY